MKGLALDIVWVLVIAIAGALIFLSLVTGTFQPAANWFYCNVYLKIHSFFISMGSTSVPETCKFYFKKWETKIEEIKERENKIFSRNILAYIIACWKETEIKEFYESHPCYEIHLLNEVENVTEYNVSQILIKEDHCVSIENSDYGCGAKNQIVWGVDGTVDPSLTTKNISDAINAATLPKPIPVNTSMFSLASILTKNQLKSNLSSVIPKEICNFLKCFSWWYDKSRDIVTLNISSINYSYSMDLVLSYLEKNGLIDSSIKNQKIILIEYNNPKDAVEVIA